MDKKREIAIRLWDANSKQIKIVGFSVFHVCGFLTYHKRKGMMNEYYRNYTYIIQSGILVMCHKDFIVKQFEIF
jgi:hypothetical protein